MNVDLDDEAAPSPEQSMRLIDDQQAKMRQSVDPDPMLFWAPWGAAWLIGFGMFFLKYGISEPIVAMPYQLPLTVLFIAMAAALVITIYVGARSARDFQGVSNTQGMMYGFAWSFAFVSVVAVNIRFSSQLSSDETGLLWAATSVGTVGALYLAGGALWRDWSMFAMGGWMVVVNAIGVLLGPGWHALLVSIAAGGGLLLGGLVVRIYDRRRSA